MTALSFRDRVLAVAMSGAAVLSLHRVAALRAGVDHALILCPAHDDHDPSCSVHLTTGQAKCHSCGFRAGDVVALHRALGRFASMGEALGDLESRAGTVVAPLKLTPAVARGRPSTAERPAGEPIVVKSWAYRRADGTVAFEVRRIQYRLPDGSWELDTAKQKPRKSYRPFDPVSGTVGMPPGFDQPGSRPLLNLQAILAADSAADIFVTEGEPAADALISIGIFATTSSGGAASAERTDWSPLAGRRVVLWPDNDDAGRAYARTVTDILVSLSPAPAVRWIEVAALGLPIGGDAVEWLAGRRAT